MCEHTLRFTHGSVMLLVFQPWQICGNFTDFVIVHLMILFRNDNILWLYSTNKHELKSQGCACTNRLFLRLRIPLCLLLFQGCFFFCFVFFTLVICPWLSPLCQSLCLSREWRWPPPPPQLKVWNTLHMILNTWHQLERRKGERQKKKVFFPQKKTRKKSKAERVRRGAPSPCLPVQPLFFSPFWVSPKTGTIKSTHVSPTVKHRNRDVCRLCPFIQPTKPLCLFFNRAIWEENNWSRNLKHAHAHAL